MTLLKRIAWVVATLIVLIVLVSFFLPARAHVERSKLILAEPHTVFSVINNIKTYDDWMPWNRKDPQMRVAFNGIDSGVGAGYSWLSTDKQVGSGTLTITESLPFQKVVTALNFGDMGVSYGGWILTPEDKGTRVVWYMDAKMTGPNALYSILGKYTGLFMGKMVGPDFENGLDSLKSVSEKLAAIKTPTIRLDTMTVKTQTILYVSDSANSSAEISQKLAIIYGRELGVFMKQGGLTMSSPPMAWYSGETFPLLFDAGIAVNKTPAHLSGRIKVRKIAGGPAVVAHFFGPYEMDPLGFKAIRDWIARQGKTEMGLPYEVYIGDPGIEKDPYKVQTDIIQLLQ